MYEIENGKRFGRLTIVKEVERKTKSNGRKERQFLCRCDCGNKKVIPIQTLLRGRTKSCGCIRKEKTAERQRQKINVGDKYGQLTIIRELETKDNKRLFLCECGCGETCELNLVQLRHRKDCGHTRKQQYEARKSPLYHVWQNMKQRCYNPKDPRYKNYGFRGITVCLDWLQDYEPFYDFAIENGWKKGLQIDRTDNDGNYEPKNVRFVTQRVNLQNKRNTITAKTAAAIKYFLSTGRKQKWISEFLKVPYSVVNNVKHYKSWNNI